ncbi:DUF2884 family protein [Aestuariibacter salexigens]|uniref:DUF2884 family protein n=1 Tax=Aestuariibacter salexigens TaxID=226010 RepID=UPI0004142557|nr:DUF2884 family protein [Aestuariibacter salexigens]
MKRTLIAASILLTAGVAQANDCNIDLDGSLTFEKGVLTVSSPGSAKMTITPDYTLLIDGQAYSTNADQQRAVEDYYNSMSKALPMTADIAVEGVQLATTALNEVFGELIGYNDDAVLELNEALSRIGEDVNNSFYAEDGSLHIRSSDFDNGVFEDHWEAELEQAIEKAVFSSMGKLLIAVGTEMLFSGGDGNAFEARMENFAEDLEQRIENQADGLEFKAEQLCDVLHIADIAEADLNREFSELSDLNLLEVTRDSHRM